MTSLLANYSNQPVTYEIRQTVRTAKGFMTITVFSGAVERLAALSFADLKNKYPDNYFEFIKVEHKEELLDFTPMQDDLIKNETTVEITLV